jgi:acetyltransferase-like isoleucine patch superfamily enzyme
MDFDGLTIEESGERNQIIIEPECEFKRSRFMIKGNGNKITICKSLSYSNFVINIRGDNKIIHIKPSKKNINGLKLVSIRGNHQEFLIGENFSCGGMEIQANDGDEKISIGNNCLFSWGIKARTSDGHSVIDLQSGKAINLPQDIIIEDSVWVGEDVSFLKGSYISKDSVVGSRAVVTKKFKEGNCVIAGFPASVVKKNIKWDYKMPYQFNDTTEKVDH